MDGRMQYALPYLKYPYSPPTHQAITHARQNFHIYVSHLVCVQTHPDPLWPTGYTLNEYINLILDLHSHQVHVIHL